MDIEVFEMPPGGTIWNAKRHQEVEPDWLIPLKRSSGADLLVFRHITSKSWVLGLWLSRPGALWEFGRVEELTLLEQGVGGSPIPYILRDHQVQDWVRVDGAWLKRRLDPTSILQELEEEWREQDYQTNRQHEDNARLRSELVKDLKKTRTDPEWVDALGKGRFALEASPSDDDGYEKLLTGKGGTCTVVVP